MEAIIEHLVGLGWKREVNYGGQVELYRPDYERCVTFYGNKYWELGRFTDSDIDGVARGRYESVTEGETLEELIQELAQ